MNSGISEHDKAVLNAILNPNLPITERHGDEELEMIDLEEEEETSIIKQAKEKEIDGIRKAESGSFDEGIALLTESIQLANRAAAYNNRAQVYRLKGDIKAAMDDLETAVHLSGGRGRSGCQAYCQRGVLYRLQGKDELAKQDFELASKLGSQFAKNQLVQMNPYAALCNQMLHQMLHKRFNLPSQT